MIYSVQKSFHPKSTSITGYFRDQDTEKWIKVMNGTARTAYSVNDGSAQGWMESLEALLKEELSSPSPP